MKLGFYSDGAGRNHDWALSVVAGARAFGIDAVVVSDRILRPDLDLGAFVGVRTSGARLFEEHLRAGVPFMFFDKGYLRREAYTRVSINGWFPHTYFHSLNASSDRWDKLQLKMHARQVTAPTKALMFAGSSQKYCNFHGLGDATAYAERIFNKMRRVSNRPLIYRLKSGWAARHFDEVVPIPGTELSCRVALADELGRVGLLVTHGSNAAVEALVAGVPIMMLGNPLFAPVAGSDFNAVDHPFWPTDPVRKQFLYNLAHCQWTLGELRSGEAWVHLSRYLEDAMREKPTSAEYMARQYQEMHASPKMFRGNILRKHAPRIWQMVQDTGAATVLDYGSGKGEGYQDPYNFAEMWGVKVACYDPGVPVFQTMPSGAFDGVVCCDVLEHIPEDDVERVLAEIFSRANKFVFLSISTRPARKFLPDGRNCHLTIRPDEWWDERIQSAKDAYAPQAVLGVSYEGHKQ